jgi:hypothetical protein
MDAPTPNRTRWPRLTLTIPPETREALAQIASRNYREPKREALRLLLDAIERETKALSR